MHYYCLDSYSHLRYIACMNDAQTDMQKELPTGADHPTRQCLLIAKDLRTGLDRDFAPFGLTGQQASVLVHCIRLKGTGPSRLAAEVGTDTAGITGLIDQLEKKGLVKRQANSEDRRAVNVEPTPEGRALAPRLRVVFRQFATNCLRGFSTEEVEKLVGLLGRLQSNAKELLAEGSRSKEVGR